MHLRTILPLIFCLVGIFPALSQGLKFTGLEQPIDKRTSYDVFGNLSPEFSDRVDIHFDMATYHESEIGYIFRIKNRHDSKVYNLFYDGQGDERTVFIMVSLSGDDVIDFGNVRGSATLGVKGDGVGYASMCRDSCPLNYDENDGYWGDLYSLGYLDTETAYTDCARGETCYIVMEFMALYSNIVTCPLLDASRSA